MDIPLEFSQVVINTTAGGVREILASATGKTARIHALHIGATGAGTVKLESGSSVGSTDLAAVAGAVPIAANAHLSIPFERTVEGSFAGTAAKNIQISSTAAGLKGWATVSSSTY